MMTAPRYQPCALLKERKIACVIWFEDALQQYEVPTSEFQLYLLVPDDLLDQAVECLTQAGWCLLTTEHKIGNWPVDIPQRRLAPPVDEMPEPKISLPTESKIPPPPSQDPAGANDIVLLRVGDWFFTFSEETTYKLSADSYLVYPRLPAFVDALIDTLLDAPVMKTWSSHIAALLGYLYGYNPEVKQRGFAERLRYDNQQYHLDSMAGMSMGTVPVTLYQRKIRNEIRQGKLDIKECSADLNDENLFHQKRMLELLKLMPPAKHSN